MKIKIVAEIGCNHCGQYRLAKKMIKEAYNCGVDAIKFQVFKAELLISKYADKAEYQKKTTGCDDSQLEMTKKLEISYDKYIKLFNYAKSLGLEVIVTPFDLDSIEFLKSIDLKTWKIPSGEITNLVYLERIGEYETPNKQIILATGMSTIEEIKTAIKILNKKINNDIIIMHCNTEYPTPDCDVNISALKEIQECFPNFKIGLSDHSIGSIASIMAVPYNIVMIEKHFTLDKNLEGPDHLASADVVELKQLVNDIKRAEKMLGNGKKIITKSEEKNITIARKSIVASKKINIGDIFSEETITCKRPGNGISPMKWYELIGKKSSNNYLKDELIRGDEL